MELGSALKEVHALVEWGIHGDGMVGTSCVARSSLKQHRK